MTVSNTTPVRIPDAAALADAAELLRKGALVAFPTETVYGLGTDATRDEAVARIFEAKGRPRFNPLIIHVSGADAAAEYGVLNETARNLASLYWPGPLTLVVRRRKPCLISELATAGLETIALRAPDHPVARALLTQSGLPLAAPSANRSGHVSSTLASHVAADLGDRVAMILDGGPARRGVESTILDVTGDDVILLRSGALPASDIESATGLRLLKRTGATGTPTAPGQLASHYAPNTPLRLDAIDVRPGEAFLAFGRLHDAAGAVQVINLSPSGDLIEAATNLFRALRELDASGASGIAVAPIPDQGLGEAINDRLCRAAAPKNA